MDGIDRLIGLALDEDMGGAGDITTLSLIPASSSGVGEFLVKEPLVLAGTDVVRRVFSIIDPEIRVDWSVREGERCPAGKVVGAVRGPMRALLSGERTALNFLQRLCGIATMAAEAAATLEDTRCRILDTRKTLPGWRALDKAAVRAGGGFNHRFGLFDGILIKDNHIAAVGSIREAVRRARAQAHHLLKIEVEVVDLPGVDEALSAGADVIMLDNMDLDAMRRAVDRIAGRAQTEASGGVTLQRLRDVAATGVDFVSMGGLTHSARARDISLEVR